MSASAPITASGSSLAPHAHRNAPGDAGGERAFHTLMDSLSEKDGAANKPDGREGSSLVTTRPRASSSPTVRFAARNLSGASAQERAVSEPHARASILNSDPVSDVKAGAASAKTSSLETEIPSLSTPESVSPPMGFAHGHQAGPNPATSFVSSESEADPTSVSGKPAAKVDTIETVTDGLAVLQSLISPSQRAGENPEPARSRRAVTTAKGHEQSISVNFSSVADDMQLQVRRAASHFDSRPAVAGQATLPMKTSLLLSLDHEGVDNPDAGSVDDLSPVVAASPEGAGAVASAGSSSASVFAGVTIPLLPLTLSQAAAALQPTQTQSTNAALPSAEPAAHTSGALTRELEIQLSPLGLGSLRVRMKLTDGALSVVIETSKPQALNAIESARHDIVERLAATTQTATSLEVAPLRVPQNGAEDTNAGSGEMTTRDDSRGQSNENQELPDRRGNREASPAPDQGPLGRLRRFVL